MAQPQTNLRLSDEGRKLLDAIAGMYGLTITNVAEIAIRNLARQVGLWKGGDPSALLGGGMGGGD